MNKNLTIMSVLFFVITGIGFAMPVDKDAKLTPDTIKLMVEHRLNKHKLDQVQVSVENDKIILNGSVQTLADKKQAEHDAHHVEEDYQVLNNLTLAHSNLTDEQIAKNVTQAIRKHFSYDVFDWITAEVQDGVVTLQGWVHEPWRNKDYIKIAESQPGVMQVKSEIRNTFGPGNLGIEAAQVLYNDPMFQDYAYEQDPPIHIIVDNGNIILEGQVESESESSFAEQLLTFNTDAVQVINHLTVGTTHHG